MKENIKMKTTNGKKTSKVADKKSGIHTGHRDRMRARFSETGFKGMHEHEMLEMLLYYSVPRRDTNPLAHALIDRFGSLAGVLQANTEQLLSVDGVTMNTVTLIRMILPLFHQYRKSSSEGIRLNTPDKTAEYLINYYSGVLSEQVVVICIDASCKVVGFETVCEGDTSSCLINCRRLIEIVLKYPMTSGVILSHNHPNGVALPSRDDVESTSELFKTLANVNIKLVDHIIVAGEEFTSMASSAQFKNLFRLADR